MSKKKQAKKDKEGNEAMEERWKKSQPNPDNSYPANPERNRIEIRAIRAQINVWKKREEKYKEDQEKKQKEEEKQNVENMESALNTIAQNIHTKTQAVHPFRIDDPFPDTQKK